MNPLDTLASVCSDIDPFADLTWMIDRLHSNAARSRLVATKSSGPFPDPQPPVALSQWSQPCATPSGINAACRLNDLVNNDVELRWKCTKPRSGLDKAASTKSNISSYGTVVSVQGALNWFASGTEAGCPPFTTANRPRGHDESPSIGEGLPPKRRRRGTVAQGQCAALQYHDMDKPLYSSGQQGGNVSPMSGTCEELSRGLAWPPRQTTNRTARRTGD